MLKIAIFLQMAIFPIFHDTAFRKVLVKQKVTIIERHMTKFVKEESWGYKKNQNEQNLFVCPPIPVRDHFKDYLMTFYFFQSDKVQL